MTGTIVRSDSQIHQAVIDELKRDTRVDETAVGVQIDKTIATLTGIVSSYAKKLAAGEAAHRVTGVFDVANDIVVQPPGACDKTDTEIARAVREALEADVFVPAERIVTTLYDGLVMLMGEVDDWAQREDVAQAILRLPGVVGVSNAIDVRSREVAAQTVRATIEEALETRAEREADRIEVIVHDGHVTLAGPVHSWAERRAVLGAAGHAPGVSSIDSRLRVSPN